MYSYVYMFAPDAKPNSLFSVLSMLIRLTVICMYYIKNKKKKHEKKLQNILHSIYAITLCTIQLN